MLLTLSLVAPLALAAEGPSLYLKQVVGGGAFPTGAISNTKVELRTPLHRSESIVFQSTYAGAGLGVVASPAFLGVGPRVSFAPIDVLDLNLSAGRVFYFDDGLGLLPYSLVSGRTGDQRDARADEGFGSGAWVATAEPTLKLKVGPIIVFDAWTLDVLHIDRPATVTAPYTYEPLRGLIVAFDDLTVDQQVGVLYDALPANGPSLKVGLAARDRFAVVSGDRTTSAGVLLAARPGIKPVIPTIVAMAQLYLHDPDRAVLSAPNIALAARWEIDTPLAHAPITAR